MTSPPQPSSASPRDPFTVRACLRLADLLLRLYPQRFRLRYATGAREHVVDMLRATYVDRGTVGVVALLPRLLWDLIPRRDGARHSTPERTSASMLDTLTQDLRFARRSMARSPGNAALAVLILAIGIGASVSMFSVIDAVMLRPLPYPESDRIMSVGLTIPQWRDNPALGDWWDRARWSYDEVVAWRERQTSFDVGAAIGRVSATLTGRGPADRVSVGLAGVGLFEVFGAAPQRGRLLSGGDEGDPAVAIVSDAFWRNRLGGDDGIVGSSLILDSTTYTVVGVLPAGFEVSGYPTDLWIPVFSSTPGGFFPGNTGAMDHTLLVMARLRAGVDPQAAAAETASILAALADESHFADHSGVVVPLIEQETRGLQAPMMFLMGAVLMLLVVACANVATLLLGQAIDRRQEIAVRAAVGAGRARVVRQLLTESLVLGAVAGGLGLALAGFGMIAVTAMAPPFLPRLDAVTLDLRVAAFAIVISLLAAVLFGMAPAISVGASDLSRALRTARSGSAAKSRLQAGMIVAEIALATVLLVGGALLTRSFVRLNAVDPGFEPGGLVSVRLAVDASQFTDGETYNDGAMRNHVAGIADAIAALPGVAGVVSGHPPFSGSGANNGIVPEGWVAQNEDDFVLGHRRFVRPGYFELMGMRLIEGRAFELADENPDGASVVVVTENLAARFFPGESAVGKMLGWWNQESTIVGVVASVVDQSLEQEPELIFYAPEARFRNAGTFLNARVEGDPVDYLEGIRNAARQAAPNTPLLRLQPFEERVAASIDQARFRTRLIGLFAVISAALSVLGVYGVTNRAVAGRARELGVRVALGAVPSRVMSMVLSGAVRLAALGIVLGISASIAATRVLEGFLFEIEPNDPVTLAAIVALVAGLAILASLVPSMRASRVDPVEVLRREG